MKFERGIKENGGGGGGGGGSYAIGRNATLSKVLIRYTVPLLFMFFFFI